MLDRTHTRAYRTLNAFRTVRVSDNVGAGIRRFLDRGAQLGLSVLRGRWLGAGRKYRSGRDDFDEICPAGEQFAHTLANLVCGIGDAVTHGGRHDDVGREAGDLAATAADGNVGARDEPPWPGPDAA